MDGNRDLNNLVLSSPLNLSNRVYRIWKKIEVKIKNDITHKIGTNDNPVKR